MLWWVLLLFQLTLVVELLQSRQAAQHRQAIPAGICPTTGVFSQAQHPETCQGTQMAELREGGNGVLPQVELTQRQTPSQGRQRWDAVGTGKEAGATFNIISVVSQSWVCVVWEKQGKQQIYSNQPQCQHLDIDHLGEDGNLKWRSFLRHTQLDTTDTVKKA